MKRIRSFGVTRDLERLTQEAAAASGVNGVVLFSGAQIPEGAGGVQGENRTGSDRHDIMARRNGNPVGNAGDYYLYVDGVQLGTTPEWHENNPELSKIANKFVEEFTFRSEAAGYSPSIGAGPRYMQGESLPNNAKINIGKESGAGFHLDISKENPGTIWGTGDTKFSYNDKGERFEDPKKLMPGMRESYNKGRNRAKKGEDPYTSQLRILPTGVEELTIFQVSNAIIQKFPEYPLPPTKGVLLEGNAGGTGAVIDDSESFNEWSRKYGQGIITIHQGGNILGAIRKDTIIIHKSMIGGKNPNSQQALIVKNPAALKRLSTQAGSPRTVIGLFENSVNQGEFIAFNLGKTGIAPAAGATETEVKAMGN